MAIEDRNTKLSILTAHQPWRPALDTGTATTETATKLTILTEIVRDALGEVVAAAATKFKLRRRRR